MQSGESPKSLEYSKIIKDPVYGYISICEKALVENVIDTPEFQRLRDVRQASYSPLFPSATHTRFCHSLGVYHLGKFVFAALKPYLVAEFGSEQEVDDIGQTFIVACLLHDVGHAPFSHIGERYFQKESLLGELDELGEDFIVDAGKHSADNHELMSVIISRQYILPKLKDSDVVIDECLFARCITGAKYEGSDPKKQLRNCVIELLNSDTIDVDKLDYLIRDTMFSGFDSVNLDYRRLLNGARIARKIDSDVPHIGFHKSAISVVENVVLARDSLYKWVINHPSILYENYLIERGIQLFVDGYHYGDSEDTPFCSKALSIAGKQLVKLRNGEPDEDQELDTVLLLSDSQVISSMKENLENDESGLLREYFDRGQRRRPIWKSESEYKAVFKKNGVEADKIKSISGCIDALVRCAMNLSDTKIINKDFIDKCRDQLEDRKNIADTDSKIAGDVKSWNALIFWAEGLLNLLEESCNECLVLMHDRKSSGFASNRIGKIPILFESDVCVDLKSVTDVLKGIQVDEKIFFIFTDRNQEPVDSLKFTWDLHVLHKQLVDKFGEGILNSFKE